ncbi:hypothetical protein N6L27_03435 [Leisingera sp. SS27]|uniref:hypothetical protein n=1 Tax=Leisingera sp. SS27 TaxID=2979462 RepID=UPI00232E1A68|nr:hypothetical protein [Leisingera sp. SS27]MDC0657043.1 hypothetical protein [Leisingera sp. SS27]
MAEDLDRAVKAFKNAVAAGDDAAATQIAKAIKGMQAGLPEREEISHTGGLSGHATQGALFGFGDEYLAGLSAVLGVQPDGQGGANWFDYSKPIGERYDTALGEIRREIGEYQEENPGKALTAQIAGGVATAGATAAGAGLKAAATPLGRVAQVAGGGAAAGAVEGFGSGEGGPKNRAVNAAIGAGVGAVFAPLVGIGLSKVAKFAQDKGGRALRAVFTNRSLYNSRTGELTDAGRKRLQQLGFDANELSSEMQSAFGVAAEKAAQSGSDDAATVARLARAERFGVPLSQGQATGNVIDIAQEEAFRAGARGQRALDVMGGFDRVQRAAVEEAREGVGQRVGANAIDRVDAADAVISGVRKEAETARQAGRAAYQVLEDAGAAVSGEAVEGLRGNIQNRVRMAGFQVGADTPNASAALGLLDSMLGQPGGAVPFTSIERARQSLVRMNQAAKSGNIGADQIAMSEVVSAFDDWVDDTITTSLIQGEGAALPLAKEARALWGKYKQTFLSRKGADNFIRKIVEDDLSPDQVAGWLYGAATTPGGGQTSLVARRVRDILGPDSAEWQSVKRAAWDHITKAPEGKDFGPQRVANNLSEFLNGKGKALAREMFSPRELQQIGEFRDLLKTLVPPQKATNPSGSGYEIQRGFMQLLGAMAGSAGGPLGAVAGREAVSQGTDFTAGMAAKAAARGIVRQPASVSTAVGAGVASGAAAQSATVR